MGLPGLVRLDHVGITVPDLAAATTVFSDVLGGEQLYSPPDAAGRGSVQLQGPATSRTHGLPCSGGH